MKKKVKLSYNCIREITSDLMGAITTAVTYSPIRESIDDLNYKVVTGKLRKKYSGDVPIDDISDEEVRNAI